MAFNAKVATAIVAVGGTGTAGFFVIRNIQQSNLISSKIDSKYLLKTSNTEQGKARITTLKGAKDEDITPKLKELKSKGDALKEKDLQDGCNSSLSSKFSSKESTEFKNILTYCAYNLGDKVTGTKIKQDTLNTESKLETIGTTITNLSKETKISDGLKKVKETEDGGNANKGNEAIKTWCLEQYKVPYYENDSDLKESQDYCILK